MEVLILGLHCAGCIAVAAQNTGLTLRSAMMRLTIITCNVLDMLGDWEIAKKTLSGSGVASIQHSVDLSWNASSSSNVVGYNVYRAGVSGGPTPPWLLQTRARASSTVRFSPDRRITTWSQLSTPVTRKASTRIRCRLSFPLAANFLPNLITHGFEYGFRHSVSGLNGELHFRQVMSARCYFLVRIQFIECAL